MTEPSVDSETVIPEPPSHPAETDIVEHSGPESPDERSMPAESLTYVEQAQQALMTVIGSVPTMTELTTEALDALTMLVLVKGDRAAASDVHDVLSVLRHRTGRFEIVPFDVLDVREQGGMIEMAHHVQRAGRAVGRDGS